MACSENPASETLADFIYRYYLYSPDVLSQLDNVCYDFVNQQFVIIHLPLADVEPISITKDGYDSIPSLYTLLDSTNMESAGILRTFDQPQLGFRGRDTLIGIVDTGIDYQNPVFINRDGTTRIVGIWDQSIEGTGINTGDPLRDIRYGTIFTEEQINEALKSDDPLSIVPSVDENGHGTFLATIAGGNEMPASNFTGAAPECRFVIVKLKQAKRYLRDFYMVPEDAVVFQENDVMMGIKYLLLIARRYYQPIVTLLGIGTNMGSHSGTSPLARYLNDFSNNFGQISVVAAGNETGRGHHYMGNISTEDEFEDVELRVGAGETGFTMELWARESELYSVAFISPTGEIIPRVPNTSPDEHRITFLLEDTVIYLSYSGAESATGSQLIMMRFQNPTPGIWKIRVHNALFIQGEYHIWLPASGLISENTFFLRPNPDTTITDPGNAALVITTAAYNHRNNSLYIHSSRGYTRLGMIKPDLAAPGVDIVIPGNQSDTGTSIAAAHMAGAAANLLSWGITGQNDMMLNTSSAKAILIRGARRNPNVTYPNREWGYGMLDLYNAFLRMR